MVFSHLVENSLNNSMPHYLIGLFVSLEFFFFFNILDISLVSNVGLVKVFYHLVDCSFVLITIFFALQKLCNFIRSHFPPLCGLFVTVYLLFCADP